MSRLGTILISVACLVLATATPASAADLIPFTSGSWEQIIAAHKGRQLFVHFWGVSCAPCRTEMPEWAHVMKENPKLLVVTIHTDRLQDGTVPVQGMLKATGLSGAQNWYFAERFQERLRYEIEPGWVGEIPMTIVISAKGERQTIVGSVTAEQIKSLIRSGE